MIGYRKVHTALIAGGAMIAAAGLLATPADAQFYKGKTVTLLIGYSPGSGVTLSGRSFARFWENKIPGNPTIVVKNLTGGGGVKAQNFVYEKAKPDGLTIYWGPVAMLGELIKSPGVRAKYEKMPFIGGSGRTLITYASTVPTGGLKNPTDITKVTKPLRIGCTRETSNFCILHRMAFDLLGIPYRVVAGFRGSEQFLRAMLQDEVDTHTTPDHSWNSNLGPNLMKAGKAKGVFYFPKFDGEGKVDASGGYPGLKSYLDIYREVKGGAPSGPKWEAMKWILTYTSSMVLGVYMPPGTPKEIVEVLRKSYKAVSEDKQYLGEYQKQFGTPLNFMSVYDAEKFLSTFTSADPAMVSLLKKVGTRKRGAKRRGKRKKR